MNVCSLLDAGDVRFEITGNDDTLNGKSAEDYLLNSGYQYDPKSRELLKYMNIGSRLFYD